MTGQWICKLQIARPPPTYCATSPTCHTQSLNSNLQQFKQMSLKNSKFSHIYFSHKSAWYTNTHTRLTALFPGLPRWAGTRKVKPIWILLKQETVRGSGISWAICKSVPCSRQITTPASQCSVFYRPGALPVAQPTASKHWRQNAIHQRIVKITLTCTPEIVVFSYHWWNR